MVSLKVPTSQSFMVLSCDPEAKVVWLGWTAIDSIELACAFLMWVVGAIWFLIRSCSSVILLLFSVYINLL